MAMSIRNRRAESLARDVAELQQVSMTQAIIEALEHQKARLETQQGRASGAAAGVQKARLLSIQEIGTRCAALPALDARTADEILGYDADGLPT